ASARRARSSVICYRLGLAEASGEVGERRKTAAAADHGIVAPSGGAKKPPNVQLPTSATGLKRTGIASGRRTAERRQRGLPVKRSPTRQRTYWATTTKATKSRVAAFQPTKRFPRGTRRLEFSLRPTWPPGPPIRTETAAEGGDA